MVAWIRVGWLLGKRQVQRTSIWTTGLIIFIMTLTFLNLVVVSGILVGLIEGGNQANRSQYTGDVIVLAPADGQYIERSQSLLATLDTLPGVARYSPRYISGASVEANYKTRRDPNLERDTAGTQLTGIDPVIEDEVTNLSQYVVEGSYLNPGEEGYVLLGANLLARYSQDFGDGFSSLENVVPGDKVRVTVGGVTKEVIVKGILDSKVGEVSIRVFMNDKEARRLMNRTNLNLDEIAIVATPGTTPESIKQALIASGFTSDIADIRTATEAIPQFLEDIRVAFGLLGNIIGFIGLIVAVITIFIIVFINAVTRRKYIGILKGIGIEARAIEFAYVVQSMFYAVIGSGIGIALIYIVLVPLFQAYPVDFPFSDGILVAPLDGTLIRLAVLLLTTAIAGYIPARMIIKQNTLNSILGR